MWQCCSRAGLRILTCSRRSRGSSLWGAGLAAAVMSHHLQASVHSDSRVSPVNSELRIP